MIPENAEDIILAQNPDLNLQEGDIQTKFAFKTKRNIRNIVIEVKPQTRRQLLQNKLKLEWTICNIDDCVDKQMLQIQPVQPPTYRMQERRDLPPMRWKT